MPTMIIRSYESASQAAAAAQNLLDAGFENVSQFKAASGKGASSAASRNNLLSDMMNAHIWKSHAEVYADRLSKGGGLVVVHAPFGSASNAERIMDKYEPVDAGLATTSHKPDYQWNDAAPLSSVLQIPVLSNTKLPAETLSGVSSLTKGSAFISNLLGIPLLSRGSAQKVSSMGMPLLSRSPTPLSSAIGLKTLSQNPTPMSSLFGLKVLSQRQ
jgi:hypothetical protein